MEIGVISIIVPCYNAEPYLQRCVDSVLQQSFTNWEMILVDDGSTDKSPRICDEYARGDERIKIIHKKNEGATIARPLGFKASKGEYIVFLDADDWLLPNGLQVLYDAITQDGGFDIVRSMVKRVTECGKEWLEHYRVEEGVFEGAGIYKDMVANDNIAPYLHSAIYRRELFSETTFLPMIEFGISVGEDWFTNYVVAAKAMRVKMIDTPTYAYYLNNNSMMGSSVYGWEYYSRIENCMRRVRKWLGEAEKPGNSSALKLLRFFFIPEVPFCWEKFRHLQPLVITELEQQRKNVERRFNPTHVRFIRYGWIYYLYTAIYRLAFLWLKLKGKKRKLIK